MHEFTNILVGLAGLAAIAIVLLAHDWREEHRQRLMMRHSAHHPLRDWWMRHRH
ncbi:hypothetical protein BGLT_00106 [Caballeronia glathei]|jgi:hypothetical protein|uniref:hypothetical protein n=1 Tax=Caballeronia glathei TaxID=60547 RepID=UPI0004FFAD37|nr:MULTISPECIES: hypothetical protein [Burkholderiaceae]TCK44301.1 hypothetical protein B0G84_2663 [Paraburkholderia sp. BL8N3]CDY73930.1 hypothetical protein BGLT_00106 [Caballeronia glathei]